MNYTLYTTRGPQLSLYSLAPSFRVSLPPCFFLSCDTGTVCWCKPVRACRLACFIITPEMSAQTALCHLPKFLRTLGVAVSAEVHTSPEWWKEHLFLAEVRQGRREARHLGKPSGGLYASDLHVSTCSKYNPLVFLDESWVLTSRGRNRERRAWETGMESLAWITQQGCSAPSIFSEIHNIFQN